MKRSIKEVEMLLLQINEHHPLIDELLQDERKGVQAAVKKWERNLEQTRLLQQKYDEMQKYEKKYRREGFDFIAGVDEVGRGPLAGPVVAAAVILPDDFYLPGIDDSKKLSERKREEYYQKIMQSAVAAEVGIIEPDEIDQINILEASKKAMLTAVAALKTSPDFLLVDAVKLHTPYPYEAIIKGDAKSISIAAASIVAKVTRDRIMMEYDKEFPRYSFAKNMGYGTKEHLEAINIYGILPIHRKSFAPVRSHI
ncbi:ribonuclease HII [Cytobacillus horneckiae]|uniref:Ribonuclease HII n=1 Tax=Cytobacillus horneckiae TaxID=549687 RepID=A0A2N0ZM41_9BACI|nr:ribonuclease HII [Cytobacillus horneckiae]MBN6887146.1 ribonuclease HII [Cytobacillus horneckiae]MEC1156997.1 ribonuclease HII [Cytobacillus horneckiae]MED2939977.1 ribonuclease HII [Cytobacillus horneckiae]PKG30573.1 ribonuclease HII [Cytobacillus horneckiae]